MGLSRATIPVPCIPLIAFFPMQVGVNRGCIRGVNLLCNFVRLGPVPFCFPPECNQQWRCVSRRLIRVQTAAKLLKNHGAILARL